MANINRRLLLHGSVRKDVGNGYQFYKALDVASEDDLRSALEALNTRYGRMYSYHRERIRAIRQQLEQVSA